MSEYLIIYTDGSSKNDRKKESSAGIAFYIPSLKLLKSRHTTGTNSVAELLAIDYALWYAKEKLNNTKVHIHSDSEYAIGVLSGKKKFKANAKLVEYIINGKISKMDVKFTHIDGHSGIKENEICDAAAKEAMNKEPTKVKE